MAKGKKPKPLPPSWQIKKRDRKPTRRSRDPTRSSRSSRTGRNEDHGLRQLVATHEAAMLKIQSEIDSFETSVPSSSQSRSVTGMHQTEIQNYTMNVPISEPLNPTASSSFQVPDSNETRNLNGYLLTEFTSNNNPIQSSMSRNQNNVLVIDNGDIDLGQTVNQSEVPGHYANLELLADVACVLRQTESQPDLQTQDSAISQSFNFPASLPNQTMSTSVPTEVPGYFANLELLADVACVLRQTESQPDLQTQDSPISQSFNFPALPPNKTLSTIVSAEVPGHFANLELLADVACGLVRSNSPLRDSVVQNQTQNTPNSEVPEFRSAVVNNTTAVPIAGPSTAAAVANASPSNGIALSQIAGAFVDVASIFRHVQNTESLVQTTGYPLHELVRNVILSYRNSVGISWPEIPMMPRSGATCPIPLVEPSFDSKGSPEEIEPESSDEEEVEDKENRRK